MSIITLLTDFGCDNWYQSEMKGVIKEIAPEVDIVDITHSIEPYDIDQGILVLASTYNYFPKETIHVIVVDPGVGSKRKAVLVETDKHFFIAPDNGILEWIFSNENIVNIIDIKNTEYFHKPVSNTFHGRDIFAPVAAYLCNGKNTKHFGANLKAPVRKEDFYPEFKDNNSISGKILVLDNFANIITNIHKSDLLKMKKSVFNISSTTITFKDIHLKEFYSESKDQEIFLLIGSSGFLEITVKRNKAGKKIPFRKGELIEIS